MDQLLLAIVELGGYPNYIPRYQAAGFEVVTLNTMRKVVSMLNTRQPDVIVAEFNFQSDFRDRTSNLETLLATCQTRCPEARVIVFYEARQRIHLERLLARFSICMALPFPIDEGRLLRAVAGECS